jgi:hypothetical protein
VQWLSPTTRQSMADARGGEDTQIHANGRIRTSSWTGAATARRVQPTTSEARVLDGGATERLSLLAPRDVADSPGDVVDPPGGLVVSPREVVAAGVGMIAKPMAGVESEVEVEVEATG